MILLIPLSGFAIGDNSDVVSLYDKGQEFLKDGKYNEALEIFQELEGRFQESENLQFFIFYKAKAQYYLNQFTEASASFNYFISRFPNSKYLAHAYFFLGNSLYLKQDIIGTFEAFKTSFNISTDKRIDSLIVKSIKNLFKSVTELTLMPSDFSDLSEKKKCRLLSELATEYQTRNEVKRMREVMSACLHDKPYENDPDDSDDNGFLNVAVLLPFSGELVSFGQDIYNGIVIAVELFRQETGNNRYKLTPYDTKGDPVEAARLAKQIASSKSIDVIIGPLTSQSAVTASAVLSGSNIPIISPAATEAGMTRLSSNSFQLSPNLELEGHLMAEYAKYQLSADSAVIISSSTTEHLRISRAFSQRFKDLGGSTIAIEYFRTRDKDFGEYIRDIKRIVLGAEPDSAFYVNQDGDTVDLDVVTVNLDCVFVTGDSRQLRQLIPQINFYNLSGAYLGSDGWGDESIFKLGDNVTRQAVFTSPFLESTSSQEYLKLSTAYDSRYGTRPKRLSSLGYDAMSLVLKSLVNNRADRNGISKNLKTIQNYAGASGNISFGEYRENIEMPFYRIINGTATKMNTNKTADSNSTN
jgi:ABC-type branched-subunit amino acid transport system substrate-binding protein